MNTGKFCPVFPKHKIMPEERFDIIDDATGAVIGTALRSECHGNPSLVHRSVHVIVLHPDGKHLLLQKRAETKDIQPGKWDTAVGGHLACGEDYPAAAIREMGEELGLPPTLPLRHCFDMKIRNEIESENTRVYSTVTAGPFTIQKSELDEVAFFSFDELREKTALDAEEFTPMLKRELGIFFGTGE